MEFKILLNICGYIFLGIFILYGIIGIIAYFLVEHGCDNHKCKWANKCKLSIRCIEEEKMQCFSPRKKKEG